MALSLTAAVLLLIQILGSEFSYSVQPGDSMTSIGARFGVDVRVIAEANELPVSARLKPEQLLQIDNRHIVPELHDTDIVVNVPQRTLFFFQGDTTRHYPIAAGKRTWPTPRGPFEITVLETNPVWDVPVSIQEEMRRQGKPVLTRVLPGPANPLGKYWLRLSFGGVGIHGTNAPASIYSLQTHGCIRMHPDDIEELFSMVHVGTSGQIIDEPILLARAGDRVFLEVHPQAYKRLPDPMLHVERMAADSRISSLMDWTLVEEVIRKRDGIARDITRR
jgi:L,D-transpeptidase ErfK/SrfK